MFVHRDLRSPNILLARDSSRRGGVVAKVADFGLARMLVPLSFGAVSLNPYWQAPEVMNLKEYDIKADVFGLVASSLKL